MNSLKTFIKGECMEMCPATEINLRQKQRLLHILEMEEGTEKNAVPKANRKKVVKSFCRSAAGKNMLDPKALRPSHILRKTIHYLLTEVVTNTKVRWNVTYDFITDRLRSVRQDMVIQNLSISESIDILQPIVNFHAYSAYRLCNEPLANFDPFINTKHLQECLKRLLYLYDEYDLIDQGNNDNCYCTFRSQYEALYLVINLGDDSAMMRALHLNKKYKTSLVLLALRLNLNYLRNNFVRISKYLKQLPVLFMAVFSALHLPEIRRKTLRIYSLAYNTTVPPSFPLEFLQNILFYDDIETTKHDCQYYGLKCMEKNVQFSKVCFDSNKPVVSAKHVKFIDNQLKEIKLSSLLLNGCKSCGL